MKKILCLYYSGVGNTKLIAEYISEYIFKQHYTIDLYSIENLPLFLQYEKYDGIIIGFPTIHCSPAIRIKKFIQSFQNLNKPIPMFVYTTCGMYQANTTRIFAHKCIKKNLITVLDTAFRMPAVDGMLLTNKIKFLERCEKNIRGKVEKKCDTFLHIINTGNFQKKIPRFKLYSILNYPNKIVGEHYTFPIYLNTKKCINCGKCQNNCPAQAIVTRGNSYIWNKDMCERCYRCIHHCPTGSLSLKRNKAPARIWNNFIINIKANNNEKTTS